MPAKQPRKQTTVVAIALAAASLLFILGLLSGLYVSKQLAQRQTTEINTLVDYVNGLEQYVTVLQDDLRTSQIQENFIASIPPSEACALTETYYRRLSQNLNYYWSILPTRLEAYEFNRELSDEYVQLKNQYTQLSLRAWMSSRSNALRCDATTIPVLYFYRPDCEACIRQGEALDQAKSMIQDDGFTIVSFAIDANAGEPTVELIEQYYGVTETPALIIGEEAYQGRVYSATELLAIAEASR